MFKYHSAVLKNVTLSSYEQQSLKIELRVVVGTTLKLNMFLNHAWNFAGNLPKMDHKESLFLKYMTAYMICAMKLYAQKTSRVIIKKDCLERNCDKCGVSLCNFSALEKDMSSGAEFVPWSCFEYVDIKSKNGQKRKLMLVKKTYNCRGHRRLSHEVIREISISQF
jgi:hypothetical protein